MSGNAIIVVNPLPSGITGTDHVCSGTTTTLSDAGSGTWSSSNTTLASVTAGTGIVTGIMAGTALIIYSLPTGCFTTVMVTINSLPSVYTMTGGGDYCSGDTGVQIGLAGSNTGISYQLYDGATTVGTPMAGLGSVLDFGFLTVAGTYTVQAINIATGCVNGMSGTAEIIIDPLPASYMVSGSGTFTVSTTVELSNSQVGVSYQLYDSTALVGSPILGTGSPFTFPVTTSGTYIIVATNWTTGCKDTMSDSAVIVISHAATGVTNQMSNKDIIIAPNPAHQNLSIKAPILNRVQVYDMTGRVLIDEACNSSEISLNLDDLNPGIYLIKINDQFMQKIVKE